MLALNLQHRKFFAAFGATRRRRPQRYAGANRMNYRFFVFIWCCFFRCQQIDNQFFPINAGIWRFTTRRSRVLVFSWYGTSLVIFWGKPKFFQMKCIEWVWALGDRATTLSHILKRTIQWFTSLRSTHTQSSISIQVLPHAVWPKTQQKCSKNTIENS